MHAVQAALGRYAGLHAHLAPLGIGLTLVGAVLCGASTGIWAVSGLLVLTWASYFFTPWSRAYRQAHLPQDPALRLPMTGILISVEACAYLLAAACIALSDGQIPRLVVLTGVPLGGGLIGLAGWFALRRERRRRVGLLD